MINKINKRDKLDKIDSLNNHKINIDQEVNLELMLVESKVIQSI